MNSKIVLLALVFIGLALGGWLSTGGSPNQPPQVRLIKEGASATVIEVTIPGLETETRNVDQTAYTQLRLSGEPAVTMDVGRPELPRIIRTLGIPENARVSVEVLDAEVATIPNILVYPAQKPLTDLDQPDWRIDQSFYLQDVTFPGGLWTIERQATWRGLPYVSIGLNPVRYNPARKELLVCSRLRVRVNHPGLSRRFKVEPWMAKVYKFAIDNFDQLDLEIAWNDNPGVRYLVIAHSNYSGGWLDSLVHWHQKRGIETRVIAKSSWTATEIKDSVRAEYNRHSPPVLRWVLLVGEYNEVPGYAYPGVGFSDVWYGDVEPPAGDDYFDLGIGRFSPSSVADLGNQIQKTLKFAKAPPATNNWCAKSGLAAHSEQYPGKYSACIRGIYHFPYAYYHYTFDTIMGGHGGTNAMVSADINEGRVVMNYRGHGSELDWSSWDANGQSWTATEINALTNGDMTPVVFNCCCLNHVLSTATCLGEAWMRKFPGGAVASLGATEASYTIPNHGWDSTLFRALGDTYSIVVPGVRTYQCPVWDLGWMLNTADAHIVKYHGSIGVDNARMYLWLGDPALNVWTGQPLMADVTYPPAVPLGNYDLDVTVMRQGSPVNNALVCAWKPGEFYVTGYTDNSGNVTLAINAQTPGEFSLTVTGHTILPHEGTILARTTGTPYVTFLKCTVNDSPPRGNGDGCINPGEEIILPTWVKNHGDSTGYSVTGKLRTTDTYVTLLDTFKSFGNIPAHDSAFTGPNGFRFQVAPACTNGHMIQFTLRCQDIRDSVWNSRIYLRVGAPSMRYAGVVVNDTVSGGNRNGRLDPNETANLIIALRNVGYGHANGVSAVLRSGDSRLIVNDSFGDYGQIMAESTRSNLDDQFTVTTLSMVPETELPCTLHVYATGGFHQVLPFTIMVGAIRPCDPVPDGPRTPALYWAYENVDTFYSERPQFNWVEINTVGTRLTLSDDQTVQISLPPSFGPFVYYGQSYNQLSICSNGFVAPGYTTFSNWTNVALPKGTEPPMLALNWDDIYPPTGNGVWYYHDAANHRFIVEWDSVAYYSQRTILDKYQVILYDTTLAAADGNCEFVYQYLKIDQNNSCTVGSQDQTYAIGINALFDGSYHRGSSPLVAGRAIKFTTDPPTGISESEAGASAIPKRLALSVAPNPAHGITKVRLQVPAQSLVRLRLFDITGRHVRTLVQSELPAGTYTIAWDGRDDAGRLVANGTYLYRLETVSGTVTTRAVLVR